MRRGTIPLLVMFVMIGLVADRLSSAPELDSSASNGQELLKRIKQLEKRVEKLEKASPRLLLEPSQKALTVVPPQSAVPQDWKRKQINGIEYYIVPLDAKQK